MTAFETVIGLEVHVQLALRSKLFSSAPVAFAGEPNSRVATVDLGLPGVLPVFNAAALDVAIRAALAFECEVQRSPSSIGRTTSTRTCRRATRSASSTGRSAVGGRVPLGDGRFEHDLDAHPPRGGRRQDARTTTPARSIDLNRAGTAR